MSDQQRNWDKELADIDRVMQDQGAGPARPAPAPAGRAAPALPAGAGPARRGSVAITWLWVLLALALAVALPLWPYQRTCGLQTVFYLGAAGITAIVGGLAAASSWANRRGFAHLLSLLTIAWAAGVAASEVLPRVGYAREARTWACVAAPAPASSPAGAPAPSAPSPSAGDPSPSSSSPSPAAP